jgi:N-acetylglucosamine-6-sulfatase
MEKRKTRRDFLADMAKVGIGSAFLAGCKATDLAGRQPEDGRLSGTEGSGTPFGKRPNFVFVMTDDQPYDGMPYFEYTGRYPFLGRNKKHGLVNFASLRDSGAHLSNTFVTYSLCSPSRGTFLTGAYANKHGCTINEGMEDGGHKFYEGAEPDWNTYKTFAVHLKQAGYDTAFMGKLHMDLRRNIASKNQSRAKEAGFDYWLSFDAQGVYNDQVFNLHEIRHGQEKLETIRSKGYNPDLLTAYAAEWINRPERGDKPFCVCVWHKAAHEKYVPPERYKNIYNEEGDKLGVPPNGTLTYEKFENKPSYQVPFMKSEWNNRNQEILDYFRVLKAVDDSVGKLIAALKNRNDGTYENTVFIYTADNGYFLGDHRLRDKRYAYEESMRIPMLISWPKVIKPGSKIEEYVLNTDIAPTILDIAGVKVPETMQGRSILPLLKGEQVKNWRKEFLFEYYRDPRYPGTPSLVAVRDERYKYVESYTTEHEKKYFDMPRHKNLKHLRDKEYVFELYDLKKPGRDFNKDGKPDFALDNELTNLIDDPQYAKIREQMVEKLKRQICLTRHSYWSPKWGSREEFEKQLAAT